MTAQCFQVTANGCGGCLGEFSYQAILGIWGALRLRSGARALAGACNRGKRCRFRSFALRLGRPRRARRSEFQNYRIRSSENVPLAKCKPRVAGSQQQSRYFLYTPEDTSTRRDPTGRPKKPRVGAGEACRIRCVLSNFRYLGRKLCWFRGIAPRYVRPSGRPALDSPRAPRTERRAFTGL